MYDNYNYPIGADTPDAVWNQETELKKTEVEICLTANIKFTDDFHIAYDVCEEDEDGKYMYDERVEDWQHIVRGEMVMPDMVWHRNVLPQSGRWIIYRVKDAHKRCSYNTIRYSKDVDLTNAEWQYVNENDYEIEIEDIDFDD